MEIKVLEKQFKVLKLNTPLKRTIDGIFFYAETLEEYSLVCTVDNQIEGVVEVESGYKSLKIEGILDFSLIGIISKISSLLAENEISIFVMSTFNTDYFMVKEDQLNKTIALLKQEGYIVIR